MASRTFKLTTTASTNLTQIGVTSAQITGIVATSISTTMAFMKFYWGNSLTFSSNKDTPTVGTDVPAMTVGIPVGTATSPTNVITTWGESAGPRGNGDLFIAVTGTVADSDTSNAPAGIVITVTWQ